MMLLGDLDKRKIVQISRSRVQFKTAYAGQTFLNFSFLHMSFPCHHMCVALLWSDILLICDKRSLPGQLSISWQLHMLYQTLSLSGILQNYSHMSIIHSHRNWGAPDPCDYKACLQQTLLVYSILQHNFREPLIDCWCHFLREISTCD